VNWRKTQPAIHFGKTLHFVPQNDVYVYFRIADDTRVMVVVNNSLENQTLSLDRFSEGIEGKKKGWEVLTEQTVDLEKSLKINAETAYIIELN